MIASISGVVNGIGKDSLVIDVGDGHVKGITDHLVEWGLAHDVIRLSEIREGESPEEVPEDAPKEGGPEDTGTTVTYSYSFND